MLTIFVVYLAAHFLAYVLFLRRIGAFGTEKGIFLYHFISALLTGALGLLGAVSEYSQAGYASLVLMLSSHGIYSVSFLELWSLAHGGYSLSVIASIAEAEATGGEPDFSHLEKIGETKQRERIADLVRMGLVEKTGTTIALTRRGKNVSKVLRGILRWVDPGQVL